MQHIEEAGVHSGDSACSLPPYSLSPAIIAELNVQTRALALALNVVGLMNVQFAVKDDEIYLIEVNPRASRTVPFVAKSTDSAIASIAARLMAGEPLSNFPHRAPYKDASYDEVLPMADQMTLADPNMPWFSVKEAVMPFARFPGVDTILGPEMRSTGEVMGWDRSFARAFLKAQMGAGMELPFSGRAFVSIRDTDKTPQMIEAANLLIETGMTLIATRGTAAWLSVAGVACDVVNKVYEGRPNIVDMLKNNEIAFVITPQRVCKPLRIPAKFARWLCMMAFRILRQRRRRMRRPWRCARATRAIWWSNLCKDRLRYNVVFIKIQP
jgi:carbamoyl-phosphate synthase large subunit